MKDNSKPLVSIRCLVYNHEPYLRQCLDGFVMQQTDFPFEAIVHDDASTDNSAAIIREYAEKYPDIIKPIYETENQFSKKDGSLSRIMNEAIHPDAKYVAYCEGDDYWTEPNKLQIQVNFMNAHPECSLTYHACKNLFEGNRIYTVFGETVNECYSAKELFEYPFQTATVLVKKEIFFSDFYLKLKGTNCSSGDILLFLAASQFGELKGLNKQMSVYRRIPSGMSNSMGSLTKMVTNYISWCKVANILGGDVKVELEKNKLSQMIYDSLILYKKPLIFSKVFFYGMMHSPKSLFYFVKRLTNLPIK